MKIEEIKDSASYAPKDMPLLKSLLEEWQAAGLTCRIHIRSGAPRYWFGARYLRRVRANLTLKHGAATVRSKSLTDAVLSMPVARWERDMSHRSACVYVFSLYGKKKRRPEKDQNTAGPQDNTVKECYITIPDSIDDELPFN